MSSGLVWKFTLVYRDTLAINLPQGAVVQVNTHPVRRGKMPDQQWMSTLICAQIPSYSFSTNISAGDNVHLYVKKLVCF